MTSVERRRRPELWHGRGVLSMRRSRAPRKVSVRAAALAASPRAPFGQGVPGPAGPEVFFALDGPDRARAQLGPGHQTFKGGEAARVGADLGEEDPRGGQPDAGNGVQLLGQSPRTERGGLVPGACAAWRGGDLLQRPGDQPVEFVDLRGEVIDGGLRHPQQPGRGLRTVRSGLR